MQHQAVRAYIIRKFNPDPNKTVYYGTMTWEEMMFTGLTFSIDPPKGSTTAPVKTFAVGYQEQSFSELDFARQPPK